MFGEALEVAAHDDLHTGHICCRSQYRLVACHVHVVDGVCGQVQCRATIRRNIFEDRCAVAGPLVLDRRQLLPYRIVDADRCGRQLLDRGLHECVFAGLSGKAIHAVHDVVVVQLGCVIGRLRFGVIAQ